MVVEKCSWEGKSLFGFEPASSLVFCSNLRWRVRNPSFPNHNVTYGDDELIQGDANWKVAFERIYKGLQPDWCACSCGAQKVMGSNWVLHDKNCDHELKPNPFEPKNNDGRHNCFKCGAINKQAGGGLYSICPAQKCEWYGR